MLALNVSRVGAACEDANAQCTGWASLGECDANARAMRLSCPRSCSFCTESGEVGSCRNRRPECAHWKSLGLCQRSPAAMLEACPLACGWCAEAERAAREDVRSWL